jgi:hypothetical protein
MKAKKVLDILNENALDGINDEIGKVWVVTAPTEVSELGDILFESRIGEMMLQARGGLDPDDVLMVTKNKSKANAYAQKVVANRAIIPSRHRGK